MRSFCDCFAHCQDRGALKYLFLGRTECDQLSWVIPLALHTRGISWSLANLISTDQHNVLLAPDLTWMSLFCALRNGRGLLTPAGADPGRPEPALPSSLCSAFIPNPSALSCCSWRFITAALMHLSCSLTWAVAVSYGTRAAGDLSLLFYGVFDVFLKREDSCCPTLKGLYIHLPGARCCILM